MKVLQIIPSYSLAWGGPPKVVHDLSRSLISKGLKIDILTTCQVNDISYPIPDNVKLIKMNPSKLSVFWTGFSIQLISFLRNHLNDYDLIHIHELWHFPHFIAYMLRKKSPFIVTVHGELDDWCLKHKQLKKSFYSSLIQKKILKEANIIHVLTNQERKNTIEYLNGFSGNIEVIPNGIDVAEFASASEDLSFLQQYPSLLNKKYILFLGRINAKKGLDLLIEAFEILSKEHSNIFLVLAGPDSEGYQAKVMRDVIQRNLSEKVIFAGTLSGNTKYSAIKNSELFVLPSYSEGFPMAVLEAMACEIPVVISNKTGINREVEEHNAGVIVKTNPTSISDGIIRLITDYDFKIKIAKNGKKMALKYFNIDKVSDMMFAAYKKALCIK